MAKIYERVLSTNILREKRRDSFDPQRENLKNVLPAFTVSATYLIEISQEA